MDSLDYRGGDGGAIGQIADTNFKLDTTYHPDRRRVTVMFHGGGSTFTRKALKSMITQACWTEEDLKRLKLVP